MTAFLIGVVALVTLNLVVDNIAKTEGFKELLGGYRLGA